MSSGAITAPSSPLDEATEELLQFSQGLGLGVAKVAASDVKPSPDKLMLNVFVAGVLAVGGCPADDETAQQHLTRAKECLNEASTWRERKHVEAADLYLRKRRFRALCVWEEILLDAPLDLLALKFASTACFFCGESARLRDLTGRSLQGGDSAVFASAARLHTLAMHAFGLEEAGEYAAAEATALAALAVQPDHIWAVHALAHALLEQGRFEEGVQRLEEGHHGWRAHRGLACHVYWHWAVFLLELGRVAEALAIFDDSIVALIEEEGAFPMNVSDASSLLWRVRMIGHDVGDRWTKLGDVVPKPDPRPNLPSNAYSFTEAHFLILWLHVDPDLADKFVLAHERRVRVGKAICPLTAEADDVADEVLAALVSLLRRDDAADACERLSAVRYRLASLGGSNAQRDVFLQTMLCAAIKSNRTTQAVAFVKDRLRRRIGHASCVNRHYVEQVEAEGGWGRCRTS